MRIRNYRNGFLPGTNFFRQLKNGSCFGVTFSPLATSFNPGKVSFGERLKKMEHLPPSLSLSRARGAPTLGQVTPDRRFPTLSPNA